MSVEQTLRQEAAVVADGIMDACETPDPAKISEYGSIIRTSISHELEARGKDKVLAEQLSGDVLLAVRDMIVRREWESLWIEANDGVKTEGFVMRRVTPADKQPE